MSKATGVKYFDVSARSAPVMPSACQSGGCGNLEGDARLRPTPPSFGEVRVNGVQIESEAIAREIQHHPAPNGESAWQEAARALALRELLLQEAERLGITSKPEQDAVGRRETEDDAIVRALLDKKVRVATVGEDECRRYYDGHIERFRTPDLFEASHILLEPEGNHEQAWVDTEAQARAIIAEIGDDPVLFAAAAQELSKCPTARQGGSLGQVRRGELVSTIQTALDSLSDETTGREPIRSRFGWHVLRLQRRIDGQTLPFEVVRDKINDMLEARAWTIAAARYAAELAQAAEVEGVLLDPASIGNG